MRKELILFVFVFLFSLSFVSATWWDSNYPYKIKITMNTTDAVKTNVTLLLNIPYNAHMMANFTDLRFLDAEEDGVLGYWFENNTNIPSTSANVYVKLNRDWGNTANTTVYLYYGNPAASFVSNMSAAFMFADDFITSLNTGIWAQSTSSFYTSNGYLLKNVGGSWAAICSKFSMTETWFEFRAWGTVGTGDPAMMDLSSTGAAERTYATSITNTFLTGIDGDTTGGTANNGTWYRGIYESHQASPAMNDVANWTADSYGTAIQVKQAHPLAHDHYVCMEGFGAEKSKVDWVFAKRWLNLSTISVGYGSELTSGALTTLNSPVNNSNLTSATIKFNSSLTSPTGLINATLYLWYTNGNLFNVSFATITGTSNSTNFNINGFNLGSYIWNVYACDSAGCNYARDNFTFNWGFVENSQVYSATEISGLQGSFYINISYGSSAISAITPYLIYNSTAYAPQQISGTGDERIFNATITIPTTSTAITQNFYWSFGFTNSTGQLVYYNSTTKTQIDQPLLVDNCATYDTQIMNFTLYDEDLRTPLNGTIELAMTFYSAGTYSVLGYFNTSYPYVTNGQPLIVCLNSSQINSPIRMDYHTKYYTTQFVYAVENKFGQNLTVSATPSQISLYDLNDTQSTPFQITLQGSNLDAISGALVDIQREYVPINQFISVETPLTDDLGTTVGHFVAENVYYNFVVTKNGQLLGTFNKQLVKCQNVVTGDCRITLNLIETTQSPTDYSTYGNISVNYQWTPSTRNLVTNWLSADGSIHDVVQNVIILDNWGNNTVCSSSATGLSGTFNCVVPITYGNTTVISYLYSDDTYLGFSIFSLGNSANTIFGGAKVILGILMYATLTLLMIANPITMVIGACLGMVFITAFHVVDGGSFIGNGSIILWFLVAGGILIWQIAKRA